MNRRHLLFAASAVTAAAAVPTIAVASIHPSHEWFIGEARELILMTDQVNAGADDAYVEAWDKRLLAYLSKVEALPLIPQNAAIKALAITVLHGDTPNDWEEDMASDQRLAGQIVRCLTGGAH